MLHRLTIALVAGLGAAPALAAPAVVADIAPVHSIVARVMAGVAAPEVLLPPGASPHGYALRPSQAAALESADVVFWTGEALTPWLADPLAALASDAQRVELAEAEGVTLLAVREGGWFGKGHEHDEHGHNEHGHRHGNGAVDGHIWLDPLNAAAMAAEMASVLAQTDPANAETYRANADAFAGEIDALVAEVAAGLDGLENRGFVVFHDAYQYFEDRFGILAAGALATHDADTPSPARFAEIQAQVRATGVTCAFAEPQYPTGLIETAVEGSGARAARLDPLGTTLEPGPGFYPALIRRLAADLAACLDDQA